MASCPGRNILRPISVPELPSPALFSRTRILIRNIQNPEVIPLVESHDTVYRSGKARICCCNKRPLTLSVSEQQRFLSGSRFITPITGQRRLCSRLSSVLGSRVRLRGSPKLGCCRAHVKGKTRSERITRRLPRLLPGREEAHVASAHMSLTKTSPMAQPSAKGAEKTNPPPPGGGGVGSGVHAQRVVAKT